MNNTDQDYTIEKEHQKEETTDLLLCLGEMKVANLRLSRRTINALARAGIITIADLIPLDQHDLFLIQGIAKQSLEEIKIALRQALHAPADSIQAAPPEPLAEPPCEDIQKRTPGTWAEVLEPFLHSRTKTHIDIFLAGFGLHRKAYGLLAEELRLSGTAVGYIQRRTAGRLIRHTTSLNCLPLLEGITEALAECKQDLSLARFRSALIERRILGSFSVPVSSERGNVDLFESLIACLEVLSDRRFSAQPLVFPVEIGNLRDASGHPIRYRLTRWKKDMLVMTDR